MHCDHVMERYQYWDECVICGARWNPELGWGVPMRTEKRFIRTVKDVKKEIKETK